MIAISTRPSLSATLIRALYKFGGSIVRNYRMAPTHPDWAARAEACERCPLRVIQCGRSYCGKPFLQKVDRDPVVDGCGCPTHAKAKDPTEHCPIDRRMFPAQKNESTCSCRWCGTLQAA